MKSEFRRGGFVGPIILIGLGVVFLLNNLGFLEWGIWETVLRLWPLLLIAVGLDLLIPRRSAVGAMLSLIVMLAVIAGAVWLVSVHSGGDLAPRVEEIDQPLEKIDKVEISLEPGAGVARVGALQDSDLLLVGRLGLSRGQRVEREILTEDGLTNIHLRSVGGWLWSAYTSETDKEIGRGEWSLNIHPDPMLRLNVELGAGEVDLDLSELTLEIVQVDVGVGKIVARLPAKGEFDVSLEGRIGAMEVIIPRGLAVRVQVSAGLTHTQLEGFVKRGSLYYSAGAEGAGNLVDLSLNQAIGSLIVRYE
jgi:hypothetical protein